MAEDKFAFISVVLPLRTCLAVFLLMSNPCGSFMLIPVLKENSFCKFFIFHYPALASRSADFLSVSNPHGLFTLILILWRAGFCKLAKHCTWSIGFHKTSSHSSGSHEQNSFDSDAEEQTFKGYIIIAWFFRTCLKDFISICRILAEATPFDSDTGKIPFSFPLSVSGIGTCPSASS